MNVTQMNVGNRYDNEPKFPNVLSSLASTRFSASHLDIPKVPKPPIALPRSMPKHHIVDIIPKPILNKAQSVTTLYGSSPDQSQTPIKPMLHNSYLSSSYTKVTKVQENLVKQSAPIYQYPLISGQIPRQSVLLNCASKFSNNIQCNTKIPPPPSVTNAKTMLNDTNQGQGISHPKSSANNAINGNSSKQTGEKNKVKFSDTVTVAVVPEIPRRDKVCVTNDITRRSKSFYQTDPKQELADSLPLCHPNEDYLKDFAPMLDNKTEEESNSKIKVVHFGVV